MHGLRSSFVHLISVISVPSLALDHFTLCVALSAIMFISNASGNLAFVKCVPFTHVRGRAVDVRLCRQPASAYDERRRLTKGTDMALLVEDCDQKKLSMASYP